MLKCRFEWFLAEVACHEANDARRIFLARAASSTPRAKSVLAREKLNASDWLSFLAELVRIVWFAFVSSVRFVTSATFTALRKDVEPKFVDFSRKMSISRFLIFSVSRFR